MRVDHVWVAQMKAVWKREAHCGQEGVPGKTCCSAERALKELQELFLFIKSVIFIVLCFLSHIHSFNKHVLCQAYFVLLCFYILRTETWTRYFPSQYPWSLPSPACPEAHDKVTDIGQHSVWGAPPDHKCFPTCLHNGHFLWLHSIRSSCCALI